jgi:tRNA 2-thiouridine synthesizing protein A
MTKFDVEFDASGLDCPLPILKARKTLLSMKTGERLHLIATDKGAMKDMPAFAKMTRNPLIEVTEDQGVLHFIIEKG